MKKKISPEVKKLEEELKTAKWSNEKENHNLIIEGYEPQERLMIYVCESCGEIFYSRVESIREQIIEEKCY